MVDMGHCVSPKRDASSLGVAPGLGDRWSVSLGVVLKDKQSIQEEWDQRVQAQVGRRTGMEARERVCLLESAVSAALHREGRGVRFGLS